MTEKLAQKYEVIKAEYETSQKTLAELETREATLKHTLIQLNFTRQFHGRGITRSLPTGFMAGGNGR
jgi:hypothetical protein